jgi:hypothetical protein
VAQEARHILSHVAALPLCVSFTATAADCRKREPDHASLAA